MEPHDWSFDDRDAAAGAELAEQLPPAVFDAHAHLYRREALAVRPGSLFATGPETVGPDVWRAHVGRQVGPERLTGALFLPTPFVPAAQVPAANQWIVQAAAGQPQAKVLLLATPTGSQDHVEALLDHPQVAGFKPYHTYSLVQPTFEALPPAYVPEWVWGLAHRHGLVITLHLVRHQALADPGNSRYLREHAWDYPQARIVLAHGGRGFHAPNVAPGLEALGDLPNLWFDSSGLCEPEPLRRILDAVGPRRLLWGSDFPVSEQRGRCVTAGDGFAWLTPETLRLDRLSPACRLLPVGLESLRALLTAGRDFGLTAADLQDVFADNARRLLGSADPTGNRTQDLYRHAKERLPGGVQLLSKRPEMMAPGQWPAYFREARGCDVWDLEGRHYHDFSTNGIGSCLLGFRDPDVTRAVQRRVALGSMCSLNPPEEVDLADLLCRLHPWAEQVRFTRCGGEACAVAVRIARATTDRSLVAICGYSGWQDWYLAANLGEDDALRGHLLPGLDPLGVPRELRGTALTFAVNDLAAFHDLLDRHGSRLAAVVMEPCRSGDPQPGFLEAVRAGTQRVGALLVFDEITIGWRLRYGGAHLGLGVAPDLAVFAKALGNGHPMAAVIGTRAAMAGAHGSFISSTYWTESVGPAAALATLAKMAALDVPAYVARVGSRMQQFWEESARRHGLPVQVSGYPCLARFRFDHEQADALRTLYTQLMLDRGFLAGTALYPTLAHTDAILDRCGEAVDDAFGHIAAVLAGGAPVASHLRGPVAHSSFRRLV